MSRYISMEPIRPKRIQKNMGWIFLIRALRLSAVWILFFGAVDLAAKEDPDSPLLDFTLDFTLDSHLDSELGQRKPVIVAVIDTGADLKHPLLQGRFWENPGETGRDSKGRDKRNNGIDDDGNGYIDDVNGWNFVNNSNQVQDHMGHGTHIAGIIAAHPSPDGKFQGVAANARIMVLKYFDPKTSGFENLRNSIHAIQYAVRMNAKIINYSGGGNEFSLEERKAIELAEKRGILVVAAAGNERSDTDEKPFFPANYKLSNILSVAAVDSNSILLPSSNYGKKSVHLAAPGQKIISTLPENSMGMMTGTSQATAFVSGSAALLLGEGNRSIKEVITLVTLSVENRKTLSQMVASQGQLNIDRSLRMKDHKQSAVGSWVETQEVPYPETFLWKVSENL